MTDLDTKLVGVVGGRTASALDKAFDITTVRELLRHYPRRLAERGELTDLASLPIDEDVTVVADVISAKVIRYGSGSHPKGGAKGGASVRLEVVVGDGHGTLHLVFFGSRATYRSSELVPGVRGLFAGKVGLFRNTRQLVHPDYQLLGGGERDDFDADLYANALIPVYPATKDVRPWTISRAVAQVLDLLDPLPDPVPAEILARHRLPSLDAALRAVHRPETRQQYGAALHRLTWDEALGVQLALAQRRARASANPARPSPPREGGLLAAFDATLPFTLTAGQREVGAVLAEELGRAHPMHRLLQGEVGSGKTVVALRAMLQVVDAGGQAALLAPTEVLAAQHARTIEAMLGPLAQAGRLGGDELGTRVALLTGSLPTAARRVALLDAASGAAGIVIGTHALIQDQVSFAELGLVVVDEQHRFGVEQRDALRSKAVQPPHLLVMTATPIPRTVAMTVFGDLDTSTLSELPAGRAPILTTVVPGGEKPAWLERVWLRIREEVAAGHQGYIVCPRIGLENTSADTDEADTADSEVAEFDEPTARRPPLALTDVLAALATGPLHGLRLAALHGRLAAEDKDRVMADFAAGRVDVLVATTVIEVGVDVPNATVMTIMDADRFGVSQLHQLRGRIGRGPAAGICLLVTETPAAAPSRERLDAVAGTTDGFALARLDVEQRREGNVLGVAQSGRRSALRLLSLVRDEDLIVAARAEAATLVAADPELAAHPQLAAEVASLVADERADYLDKA